jgi:hypothetical protein
VTYYKFIQEAKEKTIQQLDNGIWYLEPEWKDIVCREIESNLDKVEDNYLIDWWDIENVLRLEVEKRNAQNDKKKDVIDWLYDVITATVEPAIMEEENDYIKNVIEFMKTNHEINKSDNIVQLPIKD